MRPLSKKDAGMSVLSKMAEALDVHPVARLSIISAMRPRTMGSSSWKNKDQLN
jgi:hypothetical protein